MSFYLLALSAYLLTISGLSSLAVSMNKHHKVVFGGKADAKKARAYKLFGWLALGTGLSAAMINWPVPMGIAIWFALLAMAGLPFIMTLQYKPRMIRKTVHICPMVGAGMAVLAFII